jgi:hypothetical protein
MDFFPTHLLSFHYQPDKDMFVTPIGDERTVKSLNTMVDVNHMPRQQQIIENLDRIKTAGLDLPYKIKPEDIEGGSVFIGKFSTGKSSTIKRICGCDPVPSSHKSNSTR